MSIGANVKRYRLGRDMTRRQLADAIGVTQSMVGQIERGTKSMSMELGSEVASVLGIEIGRLLDDSNDGKLPENGGNQHGEETV